MAKTEQQPQAPKQRPGFAAGSEGWDGTEDPTSPVTSSGQETAGPAESSEPASAPVQASSFAAGSEGWDGSEDPTSPMTSSKAAADSTETQAPAATPGASATPREVDKPMQSDYALSQSSDDDAEDGRYSVAEEQNFDQQSDAARRVGQMPQDTAAAGPDPAAAMTEAAQQDKDGDGDDAERNSGSGNRDRTRLKQSIDRSVPPSP